MKPEWIDDELIALSKEVYAMLKERGIEIPIEMGMWLYLPWWKLNYYLVREDGFAISGDDYPIIDSRLSKRILRDMGWTEVFSGNDITRENSYFCEATGEEKKFAIEEFGPTEDMACLLALRKALEGK